jgi:hypothetical protein
VIQLHRSHGLLKVHTMTAEAQRVSNLDIGGQCHDTDLRLREVVTDRANEFFRHRPPR